MLERFFNRSTRTESFSSLTWRMLWFSPLISKAMYHMSVLVLNKLHNNQLYVKEEKVHSTQTSSFLCYIISKNGVSMIEKKVTAVTELAIPCTVKELHKFLGFANFNKWFIKSISSRHNKKVNMEFCRLLEAQHSSHFKTFWAGTTICSGSRCLKGHTVTNPSFNQ